MRLFDIALKDLFRSFRSAFLVVFMFVIPLLTTLLFSFAFGGLGSEDGGFDLPRVAVVVVNLDAPGAEAGGFSAGQALVAFLEADALAELLQVTRAGDAASARAAVDGQEAGVAVIVPAGFTASLFDPQGRAAVELYQDPTLTIGPGIVKTLVSQFVDTLAGARIAVGVAADQLADRGVAVDAATMQAIGTQYGAWSAAQDARQQDGTNPWLDVRSPGGAEEEPAGPVAGILAMTMAGMMIFFAFFTGAASSQSILQESEAGTLSRLFTTPTSQSTILGGKFIATFVTIFVQVVVLVVGSALAFKIDWGELPPLALATLGLVVLAAGFGIFLTSLLRTSKQGGAVFGGVLTVTGVPAMFSMLTSGTPGASGAARALNTYILVVPQGWAVRTWRLVMGGGDLSDVFLPVAAMVILGAVFFLAGALRFRKRFA